MPYLTHCYCSAACVPCFSSVAHFPVFHFVFLFSLLAEQRCKRGEMDERQTLVPQEQLLGGVSPTLLETCQVASTDGIACSGSSRTGGSYHGGDTLRLRNGKRAKREYTRNAVAEGREMLRVLKTVFCLHSRNRIGQRSHGYWPSVSGGTRETDSYFPDNLSTQIVPACCSVSICLHIATRCSSFPAADSNSGSFIPN